MKINLKKVMTRAWEITRKGVKNFGGRVAEYFTIALKMSWAEVKEAAQKTVEEKLLGAGYKVWAKGGHKRIYVNNLKKYLKIEEKGGDVLFNGISVDEHVSRKREFRSWSELLTGNINSLHIDLFYDCVGKEWHGKYNFVDIDLEGTSVAALIVAEVTKAIENLQETTSHTGNKHTGPDAYFNLTDEEIESGCSAWSL